MEKNRARGWLKAIWPHLNQDELRSDNYDRFTQFIAGQLAASTPRRVGSEPEVLSLLRELRKVEPDSFTRTNAYTTTQNVLPAGSNSQMLHAKTLELVLRIIFTLDFSTGPSDNPQVSINPGPTAWEDETTLSETLAEHFSKLSSPSFDMKTGRIDPRMTMAHLHSHKGLTVCWTSNLAEHLAINWKSRVISMYEHKICLWNHLSSPSPPIIPREILEEAIDTLNLLFPLNDAPTKSFLKQSERSFYGLGYCKRERCYELDKFRIWRERMADLIDVMNEEPRGVQQLALSKDGKNLLSFATFWVASTVAVLTIISIAFGTVQTVYSVKQYNLAIALACAGPEARAALPEYCA
ncbi:hypothetical protein B0H63DRAFT_510156 [Podospora didyma]|uniref:Uncharacterized protein n=1 Tax=Podospora didyma TaxID=330526 RepID=A0AAE0NPH7_9PEZI|nr:hypothetical protein B0H63DRAFT_510156 [Podospora didyma]